jgi:integrase
VRGQVSSQPPQDAPLAPRPAAAPVGGAAGARLPSYVIREQARAVINAAATTRDRLLLETLWQMGGRVTEVLRLRRCDVDEREGALRRLRTELRHGSSSDAQLVLSRPRGAGLAERGDTGMSQPRQSRVSDGITRQVMATTISTLSSSVRSGSGHGAMAGPRTARISVITAYATAHESRASLYRGCTAPAARRRSPASAPTRR